ncbi:phosphoacetylglucosamine mutase [Octopus bimaculoides]|nr:phosphoacetylglucosamine mutase [Octopus bimaculoides]
MDTSCLIDDSLKAKYSKTCEKYLNYGTAGFRTKATDLSHVMFRMGILAVLRSKCTKATIGAMITASHNPVEDNGIKIVDPMGDMLAASWEKYAVELANVSDSKIDSVMMKIIKSEDIDMNVKGSVFLAKDTSFFFFFVGQMTTPMLHYVVRCQNTQMRYGKPTENGYYEKLSTAFLKLRGSGRSCPGLYKPKLVLDAANGVGAAKVELLKRHLNDALDIELKNDGSDGILNYQCGADYVKTQQKFPTDVSIEPECRYASFDGDADRIVYYFIDKNNKFHLLDGDKIACLVSTYLKQLLNTSEIDLNIGNVLTAYSNGSAMDYIRNTLKVDVACTPTGVKHLHRKAQEYDIGIYFEANGHGTVLFSAHAEDIILNTAGNTNLSEEKQSAAQRLCTLIDLINQTVGDSISDMLLIETILHSLGWNTVKWDAIYKEKPSVLKQIKVKDKLVFKTTYDEQKLTQPLDLQNAIDQLCAAVCGGRAFVRPSGTEDVVRVFSEADTIEDAKKLSFNVCEKVYDLCNGVGDRPTL